MMSDEPWTVVFELEDASVVSVAEACRALSDGVEYGLRMRRRATDDL